MSAPADTGKTKKCRIAWISAILVILLTAVLVWVNSVYVYVGGFYRRDSTQLDLRGKKSRR